MTKLRQLWLLTALAAVAVLAGGYFLMVSPQSSKAQSLRDEADSQLMANRQLQSQIAMLKKQQKDLPRQQAELAKFAAKIPGNPALPALIRALSDSADRSGVDLVSVSPAAPAFAKGVAPDGTQLARSVLGPNGSVLATIPVSINITGTYGNVSQFLNELEALPRAMLVGGLTVVPRPAASADGTAVDADTLQATLTTNVLMTTKAPAAPARPVAPATADATK